MVIHLRPSGFGGHSPFITVKNVSLGARRAECDRIRLTGLLGHFIAL